MDMDSLTVIPQPVEEVQLLSTELKEGFCICGRRGSRYYINLGTMNRPVIPMAGYFCGLGCFNDVHSGADMGPSQQLIIEGV
jgi:hypothetical protein